MLNTVKFHHYMVQYNMLLSVVLQQGNLLKIWLWTKSNPCPNFWMPLVNTLRPRQNGRRFADDMFKRIFLNENVRILIKISLKFVPKGPINNIPALVQIMAWRRSGDKPLSEPMMVSLLMHICVTRPQWVNILRRTDCVKIILHYCISGAFIAICHMICTSSSRPTQHL